MHYFVTSLIPQFVVAATNHQGESESSKLVKAKTLSGGMIGRVNREFFCLCSFNPLTPSQCLYSPITLSSPWPRLVAYR